MPTQQNHCPLHFFMYFYHQNCTLKRRNPIDCVIHKLKGHYLDTKHPIIMENFGIKKL